MNRSPYTLSQLALEIAIEQLGQQEQPRGSNSGPMVDRYLAAVGLQPGYAWCQAFVNWIYEEAAKKLGVAEPVVNTGSVQQCWDHTPASRKLLRSDLIRKPQLLQPGDQLIFLFGGGTGHTCLVEKADITTMQVHTIEGNTNDEGSREGYEVARRIRRLLDKTLMGCIHYA